jgi:ankyrin repeat protein
MASPNYNIKASNDLSTYIARTPYSKSSFAQDIQGFIERGANPDVALADHTTAIKIAARHGDSQAINILIQAKQANPQASTSFDHISPAFIIAAQNGHVETMLALFAAGASLDASDSSNNTALDYLAEHGDAEGIEKVLTASTEPVRQQAFSQSLVIAARKGHNQAMFALLKAGASLEVRDRDKKSALDYLAERDDREAMPRLLAASTTPQALTSLKEQAALYAANNGSLGVLRLLDPASAQHSAKYGIPQLMIAAYDGNTNRVKELLAQGHDVNATIGNGVTALRLANQGKHDDAALALSQAASKVDSKEKASLYASSLGLGILSGLGGYALVVLGFTAIETIASGPYHLASIPSTVLSIMTSSPVLAVTIALAVGIGATVFLMSLHEGGLSRIDKGNTGVNVTRSIEQSHNLVSQQQQQQPAQSHPEQDLASIPRVLTAASPAAASDVASQLGSQVASTALTTLPASNNGNEGIGAAIKEPLQAQILDSTMPIKSEQETSRQ